jgi:hypothetical protein
MFLEQQEVPCCLFLLVKRLQYVSVCGMCVCLCWSCCRPIVVVVVVVVVVQAARIRRTSAQVKRDQRHVQKWRRMLGSQREDFIAYCAAKPKKVGAGACGSSSQREPQAVQQPVQAVQAVHCLAVVLGCQHGAACVCLLMGEGAQGGAGGGAGEGEGEGVMQAAAGGSTVCH